MVNSPKSSGVIWKGSEKNYGQENLKLQAQGIFKVWALNQLCKLKGLATKN